MTNFSNIYLHQLIHMEFSINVDLIARSSEYILIWAHDSRSQYSRGEAKITTDTENIVTQASAP